MNFFRPLSFVTIFFLFLPVALSSPQNDEVAETRTPTNREILYQKAYDNPGLYRAHVAAHKAAREHVEELNRLGDSYNSVSKHLTTLANNRPDGMSDEVYKEWKARHETEADQHARVAQAYHTVASGVSQKSVNHYSKMSLPTVQQAKAEASFHHNIAKGLRRQRTQLEVPVLTKPLANWEAGQAARRESVALSHLQVVHHKLALHNHHEATQNGANQFVLDNSDARHAEAAGWHMDQSTAYAVANHNLKDSIHRYDHNELSVEEAKHAKQLHDDATRVHKVRHNFLNNEHWLYHDTPGSSISSVSDGSNGQYHDHSPGEKSASLANNLHEDFKESSQKFDEGPKDEGARQLHFKEVNQLAEEGSDHVKNNMGWSRS